MKQFIIIFLNFWWVFGFLVPDAQAEPAFPYEYPFRDAVLAQELREKPVVIELFTSLDCLFCPRAERLLHDMAAQTSALVVACYTDAEGPAYPPAREFCRARQERHAARLTDGMIYTPQMVINGTIDAVGHEFKDVRAGLTQALAAPPVLLTVRAADEGDLKLVEIPALSVEVGQKADIVMMVISPPVVLPKDLPQASRRPDPIRHAAIRFTPLGGYDGTARTVRIPFAPDAVQESFVILVEQGNGKILASGVWPTRTLSP